MRQGVFYCDGENGVVGFTNGERWNGWMRVAFELDDMQPMIDLLESTGGLEVIRTKDSITIRDTTRDDVDTYYVDSNRMIEFSGYTWEEYTWTDVLNTSNIDEQVIHNFFTLLLLDGDEGRESEMNSFNESFFNEYDCDMYDVVKDDAELLSLYNQLKDKGFIYNYIM